jgi:hypothetical protein
MSLVGRGSKLDRAVWATLFASALGTLVAARTVKPALAGLGTHEQLGLPPCGLYALLSLPCPACGLTTAFAHLARLDLQASLQVHPLGLPLFLATVLCLPLSAWAWFKRMAVSSAIDALEAERWALWLVLALLGTWCARLLGNVLSA